MRGGRGGAAEGWTGWHLGNGCRGLVRGLSWGAQPPHFAACAVSAAASLWVPACMQRHPCALPSLPLPCPGCACTSTCCPTTLSALSPSPPYPHTTHQHHHQHQQQHQHTPLARWTEQVTVVPADPPTNTNTTHHLPTCCRWTEQVTLVPADPPTPPHPPTHLLQVDGAGDGGAGGHAGVGCTGAGRHPGVRAAGLLWRQRALAGWVDCLPSTLSFRRVGG